MKALVDLYREEVGVDANMRRLNTVLLSIRLKEGALWATPNARDWKDNTCPSPRNDSNKVRDDQLPRQVSIHTQADLLWATDEVFRTLGLEKVFAGSESTAKVLSEEPTGDDSSLRLNPRWVELLMGFPEGWLDPECDSPVWHIGPHGEWKWPMGRGVHQHQHEPERLTNYALKSKEAKWRNAEISMLGNAQAPHCKVAARRMLQEFNDANRI